MRLERFEIDSIRRCAARHFGQGAVIRLFGSRTNDALRGGDIDLHIEAGTAERATVANEIAFLQELKAAIGEQRIDLVLRPPGGGYSAKAIDRIAETTGMVLS